METALKSLVDNGAPELSAFVHKEFLGGLVPVFSNFCWTRGSSGVIVYGEDAPKVYYDRLQKTIMDESQITRRDSQPFITFENTCKPEYAAEAQRVDHELLNKHGAKLPEKLKKEKEQAKENKAGSNKKIAAQAAKSTARSSEVSSWFGEKKAKP